MAATGGGTTLQPRCRAQLAIVSGGHPRVGDLTRWLAGRRPSALEWAPLVADLLDPAPDLRSGA